jgi:hypothetical protein
MIEVIGFLVIISAIWFACGLVIPAVVTGLAWLFKGGGK